MTSIVSILSTYMDNIVQSLFRFAHFKTIILSYIFFSSIEKHEQNMLESVDIIESVV